MKNKNGFTLIELMVVISLIAILSAVSYPGVRSWLSGYRVTSAANELRGALQRGKAEAVKNQVRVVVNINQATRSYTVALNGTDVVSQGTLHPDVVINQVNFNAGMWTQFNSMGIPFGFVAGLATNYNGNIIISDAQGTSFRQITLSPSGSIVLTKGASLSGPFTE